MVEKIDNSQNRKEYMRNIYSKNWSKTRKKCGIGQYDRDLIDRVKESLPNINAKVGDSEDLEFLDNFFNIVFCFRSTWYFPNLIKAINEMLRVAKNDGIIMFDIQNINHQIHKNY